MKPMENVDDSEKKESQWVKGCRTTYNPEPDFNRPKFEFPEDVRKDMMQRLWMLYGLRKAEDMFPEMERILRVHLAHKSDEIVELEKDFVPADRFTQKDIILITYGDLVQGEGSSALRTLIHLAREQLQAINTIHILPFFPSSSDRGFSIKDFESVDPHLGTWEDIEELERYYKLMFDGVFNHVSSKSRWFHEFLCGNPDYSDYFLSYGSPDELTAEQRARITRPRTSDILTRFETIDGPAYVWTTFSPDQIDLNFHNPEVLLRILEVLLFLVRKGADVLRLDAVTYLWSEPGTSCASLTKTHEIVKLFRQVLELVAPRVSLITETNVPHKENISYFGNGHDEAHMVYNFALPPLVLYTIYTEDATALTNWAQSLQKPSDETHYFNFLDSHDGFGLMGVRDILTPEQIQIIVDRALDHGGFVSYKTSRDGREVPYELNITLFSALNRDGDGEDLSLQVQRLLAARTVTLVLQGVPGIYLLGLIGKRNDIEAVQATNSNRAINRTVLDAKVLREQLKDPDSKLVRIRVISRYTRERVKHRAFHPNGPQKVLSVAPELFCVLRTSPEGDENILAITNMANRAVRADISLEEIGTEETHWVDVFSRSTWEARDGKIELSFESYGILWLKPRSEMT